MAGLLDIFTNMTPEQNQGLLAAAANILQQSGPGRPFTLGQALGAGVTGYQGALEHQRQRAILDEQRATQTMLTNAKMQELLRKQKQEGDLADFYKKRSGSGLMNPAGQTPASHMDGSEFVRMAQADGKPTDIATLNTYVDRVNQGGSLPGAAPALAQPGASRGNMTENWFKRMMAEASDLRAAGFYEKADDKEKLALQYRPQAKWQTVKQGGRVVNAPFFDDGTDGPASGYEIAEKLNFQDIGPATVGFNSFTGAEESRIQNGVSPNTAATVAAQRERTSFERQQAGKPVYDRERGVLVDPRTGIASPIRNADGTEFGTKERQQRLTDAKTVINLLDEAEGLIEKSTSSYGGWAYDQVARIGGHATEGAQAGAQLKVIAGSLVGAMPKFPGPASNLDVQLYREAAGQLEDTTLPVSTRLAAAKTLRGLNNKALGLPPDARQDGKPTDGEQPVMSLADIAETARRSGRSTREVTAAARARGFKIQGDK